MVKIYCIDNSELADFEASSRGYRSDVYVKTTSNQLYQLHVYDLVRLQQDFETEIELHGYFGIEPNVILVKEVTFSNIKLTVEKLIGLRFFEYLKPIQPNEIDKIELTEI